MSLIVTPAQLNQKAEFYYQLAQMTTAGVTIVQGIDLMRRNAPNRQLKQTAAVVMEGLVRGQNFTESLQQTRGHIPEFDISLIDAGEKSGRLDQCFRLLADFYRERASLASKVISSLMYPAFLVHFAVLIFPTTLLSDLVWKGEVGKFVLNKLTTLLPIYAVVFVFLSLMRADKNPAFRAVIEQFFMAIPVLGNLRRDLALARLCAAMEALINAGVTIIEAWDLSGRASGSPRFMRAIADAKPRLQAGELPSEAIAQQGIYPDLFVTSYRTGEVSGQLDDALRRLYRYYQESASEGLRRLAIWMPKVIVIGVMLAIAYQIVSFWQSYYNNPELQELLK